MSFSVAIFGRCELPREAAERWKRAPLSAAEHDDWVDDFEDTSDVSPNVASFLARWSEVQPPSFLVHELRSTALEVRGVLDEDTYRLACTDIATAFRATAKLGGHGELAFVLLAADGAYRVTVGRGDSALARAKETPAWRARVSALLEESRTRFDATPAGRMIQAAKA